MKLDVETLDILKNFAAINPSLMVKAGNVIRTISLSQSVIARAKLKQSFENTFAIYNLSNFISAMSMFSTPELDFADDRFVAITNEDKSAVIHYFFSDPAMVILPPDKEFGVPTTDIKFRLTKETLLDVKKAVSILALPEIVFVGDGKKINVQAVNSKSPTSNIYKRTIAESSAEFNAYFKVENIGLIDNDYDVAIAAAKSKGAHGIAHFGSPGLEYWIAVEQNSKL